MTKTFEQIVKDAKEDAKKILDVGRLHLNVTSTLQACVPQTDGFRHIKNYIREFPLKSFLAVSMIALSIAAPFMSFTLGLAIESISLTLALTSVNRNFFCDKLFNLFNKITYGVGDEIRDISKDKAKKTIDKRDQYIVLRKVVDSLFFAGASLIIGLPAGPIFAAINTYLIANCTLKDAADVGSARADEHPTTINIALGNVEKSIGHFASSVRATASKSLGLSR